MEVVCFVCNVNFTEKFKKGRRSIQIQLYVVRDSELGMLDNLNILKQLWHIRKHSVKNGRVFQTGLRATYVHVSYGTAMYAKVYTVNSTFATSLYVQMGTTASTTKSNLPRTIFYRQEKHSK